MREIKDKDWIFWKWKGDKTWSKDYVQKVIDYNDDKILELTESDWYSKHPTRVSLSDIEYKITEK